MKVTLHTMVKVEIIFKPIFNSQGHSKTAISTPHMLSWADFKAPTTEAVYKSNSYLPLPDWQCFSWTCIFQELHVRRFCTLIKKTCIYIHINVVLNVESHL